VWLWVGFGLLVVVMLALDLGVFHRKTHVVQFKEALVWSGIWIALALAFNYVVYLTQGPAAGIAFLTGYLIEKSLSVDNVFVFLIIFAYFRIDRAYEHKVLFWGILGALVFRAIFIALGITALERFHWMIYVFGGLLIVTGARLWFEKDKEIHPDRNLVVRAFKKIMPTTMDGSGRFFVREGGRWAATPLFIALIVVETSDIIFAIDSIPAILSITTDPFIVYTSNVFAILGLRSLYFALAGVLRLFHHLHYGLSAILVFVGLKMVASDYVKVPVLTSLGIIALILALAIAASMIFPQKPKVVAEITGSSPTEPASTQTRHVPAPVERSEE
jgi:tellurite resistance protein TerC